MSEKKIENYLAISFGKNALSQFDIIKQKDVDYSLYHISLDAKIKEFTPRMSTRLFPGETTAIPRVSTAPTIIQCLIGYGDIFYANSKIYQDAQFNKAKEPLYHIYEMNWEYAVQPTKKYLPDIKQTDEHWLIPYSPDERIYKGNIIGNFFIYSATWEMLSDYNLKHYTYYLKTNKRLQVAEGIWVERGFYKIDMKNFIGAYRNYDTTKNTIVTPIKEGEYLLRYNLRTSQKKNVSLK